MSDALDLLEALHDFDIVAAAGEALAENEDLIADQIGGQMAKGLNGDGSRIEPEYKALTIILKEQKSGLAGVVDHVTLYDHGDHYDQLYADVQGDELEIGSKDPKSPALQTKYGDGIYAPGETARENVIQDGLRDSWEKKVADLTGLVYV